jgi:hypothetical protein
MSHQISMKLAMLFLLLIYQPISFANNFIEEVTEKGLKYQLLSESPESLKLNLEGKKNLVDKHLITLVADNKKTAVDYFLLSNMLYESNHELSFKLMKRAYKKNPEEIYINYEMALHHHRNKNYKKAIKFYNTFQKSQFASEHHASYALLADCLLRTGKYSEAIDAWLKSDPELNSRAIEQAIYTIYGEQSPNNKRSDLYEKINKGEKHLIGELIYLDYNWQIDWWNVVTKKDFLSYDLNYAKSVLREESQYYKETLLLEGLLGEKLNSEKLLKRLEELKIWGPSKNLPKIPKLTYYFIKRVTDIDLLKTKELLQAYEEPLLDKLNQKVISKDELKILSFLYSQEDLKKLHKLDLFAWKKLNSQVAAESFLFTKFNNKEGINKDIKRALKDFPNSEIINLLNIKISEGKKGESARHAIAVAAEFANIKYQLNLQKLNQYFYSLAKTINHRLYTNNNKQRIKK